MKFAAPTGPTQPYRTSNQQPTGQQPQGNYNGDSYGQQRMNQVTKPRQFGREAYTK